MEQSTAQRQLYICLSATRNFSSKLLLVWSLSKWGLLMRILAGRRPRQVDGNLTHIADMGCTSVSQPLDMQVFKPFKDRFKHHKSKSIAMQAMCTADAQSFVPGLPGLKCDMLQVELVSGAVRHCCDSL
eukprot:3060661-Amphidinium_carterae.1